jgi:hypothetical protein
MLLQLQQAPKLDFSAVKPSTLANVGLLVASLSGQRVRLIISQLPISMPLDRMVWRRVRMSMPLLIMALACMCVCGIRKRAHTPTAAHHGSSHCTRHATLTNAAGRLRRRMRHRAAARGWRWQTSTWWFRWRGGAASWCAASTAHWNDSAAAAVCGCVATESLAGTYDRVRE